MTSTESAPISSIAKFAAHERLMHADRVMLANGLGEDTNKLFSEVFGESSDPAKTDMREGEELVNVEDGLFRFGRYMDGKSHETTVTFIPKNPTDVSVQLKTSQRSGDLAPAFELASWKGDEESQIMAFDPNMTAVPDSWEAESTAVKACDDFLATTQAQISATNHLLPNTPTQLVQ